MENDNVNRKTVDIYYQKVYDNRKCKNVFAIISRQIIEKEMRDLMAISIRDVARVAGVSVSTVSRALNGYTDVKEETRMKIRETAKLMGYSPNQSARNLSSKAVKSIALLISNIAAENKMDEFTANILRGMYGYMNEKNTTIATYGITTRMQEQKSLADFCDEYSLSGVLLMGMRFHDPYLTQAEESSIPCVSIDFDLNGEKNAVVTSDDVMAFEELTDYLFRMGHRRMVLVSGVEAAQVTHLRQEGFMRSIKKHGSSMEEIQILRCEFKEETAYINTKRYINTYKKEKATVFICMSDLMALGVIRAITDCGYSVPEDFSVTGFDGMFILDYIKPGLTTIDQNISGKGYIGIQSLMKLMNGEKVPHRIFVPHKIIYRDSVRQLSI